VRDGPTTSENEFYRDNGFLSIADFLQHDELEEWRAKVDAAVMKAGAISGCRLPLKMPLTLRADVDKEEQEYYNRVLLRGSTLADGIRNLRASPSDALGSFVARLAGVTGSVCGMTKR